MADPVEIELLASLRGLPENRRADLQIAYMRQRKSRGTALLLHLLIFIGLPGIGRIYVGDVGIGIAQFLLSWLSCGVIALWPLIDLFLIMGAADNHNRATLQRVRLAIE